MKAITFLGTGYSAPARRLGAAIALAVHVATTTVVNCVADAAPPTQETTTLNEQVLPVDSALAAIKTGLGDLVSPESITIKESDVDVPLRIFFVEGKPATSPDESPVLARVQVIAHNYGLELESQHTTLADGAPLFGFLLFEPFEMLRFYWSTHPFESVADAGGRWRQPVADLCDVESVQISGESADLVLTEGAARRLDRLSVLHGHRVLRMNVGGNPPPSYTWYPGLRTIPRVEVAVLRDASHSRGDTTEPIPARVRCHTAARARLLEELGLSDDVSWNVIENAPLYTQPVYLYSLYAPERDSFPKSLPPLGTLSPETLWCELGDQAVIVPKNWAWKSLPTGGAFIRFSGNEFDTQELNFFQALEENVGRRAALVVNGRVAGIVTVTSPRWEGLKFEPMPSEVVEAVASAWRSAGGLIDLSEKAAAKEAPAESTPDTFQVRLMAEPQDREYVAVTHFEAPGATRGIQVAVRKEVILDGRAVTGAAMEADGVTLHLTFTPEAQDALGGACFANMGKQLAILYKDRLLCAPTIDEWEIDELSFKGIDSDWPDVARDLAAHLSAKG